MRELSAEELAQKESELKDQLLKLRFQHAQGQLENAAKMKTIRRDIARIRTILEEMKSKTE
ncbi:MAG: 50S ribosomal protein L29 [Candidatus Aminicenantales bacterium]|jgi:large subunit ribosomal protein L29